jgi:hypothetical protein
MKVTKYILPSLVIICFKSAESECIKLSNPTSLLTYAHVFLIIFTAPLDSATNKAQIYVSRARRHTQHH